MLMEQDKDKVYFSALFAAKYQSIYEEICSILNTNGVVHGLLVDTKDYWCRDYMPVQCGYDHFTQFHYHPDYLKGKEQYETPSVVVQENVRKTINCMLHTSSIIADGGNFTICVSREGTPVVVMTEKVFVENPSMSEEAVLEELYERFDGTKILLLPWDRQDKCGHTDGIVHNVGDGKVLVNLAVYPKAIAAEMRKRLETTFEVVDLKLSNYHKYSWAYINMLQTREVIIVPSLGLSIDNEVLEQVKQLHTSYKGRIFQVNVEAVVRKWGGALNCLTWTVGEGV